MQRPLFKNPGARRVHTKAWDDCVAQVKKRGTAVSAYAVCTAALGETGILKSHRHKNPVRDPEHKKLLTQLSRHFQSDERAARIVRRVSYMVTAKKGRETLYLDRKNKFTRAYDRAAHFASVKSAIARARSMLHLHRHLRAYQMDVRLAS